ncbi:hypothetical protein NEOKW01_0855 [Nematocida sp. AWRm80]|nr:hypothetical protein NEOKW01_0855 [Nematocida sp. AWRm80]
MPDLMNLARIEPTPMQVMVAEIILILLGIVIVIACIFWFVSRYIYKRDSIENRHSFGYSRLDDEVTLSADNSSTLTDRLSLSVNNTNIPTSQINFDLSEEDTHEYTLNTYPEDRLKNVLAYISSLKEEYNIRFDLAKCIDSLEIIGKTHYDIILAHKDSLDQNIDLAPIENLQTKLENKKYIHTYLLSLGNKILATKCILDNLVSKNVLSEEDAKKLTTDNYCFTRTLKNLFDYSSPSINNMEYVEDSPKEIIDDLRASIEDRKKNITRDIKPIDLTALENYAKGLFQGTELQKKVSSVIGWMQNINDVIEHGDMTTVDYLVYFKSLNPIKFPRINLDRINIPNKLDVIKEILDDDTITETTNLSEAIKQKINVLKENIVTCS